MLYSIAYVSSLLIDVSYCVTYYVAAIYLRWRKSIGRKSAEKSQAKGA